VRSVVPLGVAVLGALGIVQVAWAAGAEDEAALQAYLKATSKGSYDYQIGWADLNADGRQDAIVRFTSQEFCGSGGCGLEILVRRGRGFRSLGSTTITRLPVKVLETRHHGWRDISVFVAGGGILPGYTARMSFDGRRYPPNPTTPPARPMKGSFGRVIIDKDTPVHSLVPP
jgi:hypothetical protein